jgi:hypothetical protein
MFYHFPVCHQNSFTSRFRIWLESRQSSSPVFSKSIFYQEIEDYPEYPKCNSSPLYAERKPQTSCYGHPSSFDTEANDEPPALLSKSTSSDQPLNTDQDDYPSAATALCESSGIKAETPAIPQTVNEISCDLDPNENSVETERPLSNTPGEPQDISLSQTDQTIAEAKRVANPTKSHASRNVTESLMPSVEVKPITIINLPHEQPQCVIKGKAIKTPGSEQDSFITELSINGEELSKPIVRHGELEEQNLANKNEGIVTITDDQRQVIFKTSKRDTQCHAYVNVELHKTASCNAYVNVKVNQSIVIMHIAAQTTNSHSDENIVPDLTRNKYNDRTCDEIMRHVGSHDTRGNYGGSVCGVVGAENMSTYETGHQGNTNTTQEEAHVAPPHGISESSTASWSTSDTDDDFDDDDFDGWPSDEFSDDDYDNDVDANLVSIIVL